MDDDDDDDDDNDDNVWQFTVRSGAVSSHLSPHQ